MRMTGLALLANIEAYRAAGRYIRQGPSLQDNGILVVTVLAIALFWTGLYLWDRHRKSTVRLLTGPRGLFQELCQVHRLSPTDQALLSKAADRKQLDQPAVIFVDPRILSEFATSPHPEAADYARLSEKLFGASAS
jgi:hypothetical protein